MQGANVGRNCVIDSLDIHNADLLTIGQNVTIQNDAMVTGHSFVKIRESDTASDVEAGKGATTSVDRQALLLGRCWVKDNSIVGPYSMVGPSLPSPTKKSDPYQVTVVEDVLPGYQSTSRLGKLPSVWRSWLKHGSCYSH